MPDAKVDSGNWIDLKDLQNMSLKNEMVLLR